MNRSVHIVALAARTPVGLTAEGSAAAVRAGISRLREHPFIVDAMGERLRCASDAMLDPLLMGTDRMSALATAALSELLSKLRLGARAKALTLLLALPEARPGFGVADAARLQRDLTHEARPDRVEVRAERSGEGHAGALHALERAVGRIAAGQDELCIVGGVESYLDADTLDWLEADRRLARAGTRAGFCPGEGACLVALASSSARKAAGLPSLGVVQAVACTREKRDPTKGAGLLGEALTAAVREVAAERIEQRAYVDDVYCDINGERPRVSDWGFALLRTASWFRDGSQYVMPVGSCGDLGAASAAFSLVLAVRAWQRGYAHGPRAVVWGASWQGLRGAALLERGEG
jgi:3-oxoacyl-[acyl-carrier-protein] synthase-1